MNKDKKIFSFAGNPLKTKVKITVKTFVFRIVTFLDDNSLKSI